MSQDERTALHWACSGGHAEIAETLLKASADVNVVDEVRTLPCT